MLVKARDYLSPNCSAEEFRFQIRGPPVNYFYGCHVTTVTLGALGYVSFQKGIIQGHSGHKYATREAPGLCPRIVFRAVLWQDIITQIVFLYYMSVKTLWGVISYVSRCPCYALDVMQNRWNQYNFSNSSSVIHIGAHVNSSAIANICWLTQTFK